ncbi:MAG: sigma-70 family RNA polymerase sigma factor [Deltaproteobacteria bacterium]|nr:sigma-70 family RNA polymerase sigma factor [Deltaproteobacteria bacterium]
MRDPKPTHPADTHPERWVDEHGDALYRFALMRLQDPSAAEEVVQETLLAGLKSRHSFSGRSSERTWLVGILRHKLVDFIRKHSRERPGPAGDAGAEIDRAEPEQLDAPIHWPAAAARWSTDPAVARQRAEIREAVTECVDELPPRQADAFSLKEIEDVDAKEICRALGISEANLWVLLHRARQRLRGCLADSLGSEAEDEPRGV